MKSSITSAFRRLLFAPAIGLIAAALAVGPAWAQSEKKEPTPADTKDAKDTAKEAKEAAKDTAKDAKDTAKDAKDTAKEAKDTAKEAKDTAKNTAKTSKDRAKSTKDSAKDPATKTSDRAKDSAKDSADRAKSSAKDSAKTQRDARDTARDTRNSTRDTARDRRDLRDDRDTRDARDTRDIDRRDTERRDARTDVRDRPDTRVTRAQIDKFRAESVTARDLGVTFGRATDRGLVIQDLSRSAILADFGLRRDDVIVSVADHRVASEREFFRWMFAEDLRHERITIIVLRNGREVPIYVRPVTIIEELVIVQDDFDPLHQFGIVIDDRRPREVVVVRVLPGTPAFRAGFREGDVITTFRGQRLLGPQQFVQVLSTVEPGEVVFEVNRNRQVRELQVDLPQWRTVARPDLDVDAPAIERREERRESRIERREERRDGTPGVQPVQPAPPVVPARPPRPAILPRNR